MGKKLDVWNSERAKEVFLVLSQKSRTPRELATETEYAEGNISNILQGLEEEKLVFKSKDKRKGTGRKPQTIWEIQPIYLLQKLVYPKNPFFGKYNFRYYNFKFLPKLLQSYLKIVADLPLYRTSNWIETQPNYKRKIWQEKNELTGEQKEVRRNWQSYKNERTIYGDGKVNLKIISEGFIEYLLRNRARLNTEENAEMFSLLDFYHLSLESDYFYDP